MLHWCELVLCGDLLSAKKICKEVVEEGSNKYVRGVFHREGGAREKKQWTWI